MPGSTKTFRAANFPEFNQWVKDNPYIHLADYGGEIVKAFLTPVSWGAHMPEAYAMLAPKILNT